MRWVRAAGGGRSGAAGWRMFPEGHPRARFAPLLLVLTFLSGLVDAASFLGLGRVFVANMTGNVVFLGFALSGVAQLSALASAVALTGFLAGAVAGGAWRRNAEPGRLFAPLVGVQALLVALALAGQGAEWGRYAVLVPLACGMGLQNAVVHRLGVPDLTTTVMTRTLTGLAVDRPGPATVRRGASVVTLAAGALVGGLLHARAGVEAVLVAALVLSLVVALAALRGR
ncbi:YoaK family protein [Streptomyces sp. S1]|uniref:YoaK family protein n=1 Tax=Streptomyces sp. S1 TaxID=718288 RepID=UPI003D75F087